MAWIDDVIAVYGEPRVRVDEPQRMRDDSGDYEKRCWVWFPSATNHNIAIKRYRRWDSFQDRTTRNQWVVRVGSHRRDMPAVEWSTYNEPDDALMRMLLSETGFLATAASG